MSGQGRGGEGKGRRRLFTCLELFIFSLAADALCGTVAQIISFSLSLFVDSSDILKGHLHFIWSSDHPPVPTLLIQFIAS